MDYIRTWKEAVERLWQIYKDDDAFVDGSRQIDKNRIRGVVAELYVRYVSSSNELTVCHDFIIQPQIRILTKRMLMCIYCRVLELKQFLMDEDLSIYTPIIEELTILKISYEQFELKIPRCFREERQSFLKEIDNKIDYIISRTEIENQSVSEIRDEISELDENWSSHKSINSQETLETEFDLIEFINKEQQIPLKYINISEKDKSRELAIKFIQKHIRATRDRTLVNELLAAKRLRENIISGKYKMPSKEDAKKSAIKIQRYWRFYRLMRQIKARKQRKYILVGMYMSSERPNLEHDVELENKIQAKQTVAVENYWKSINEFHIQFNKHKKYEIIEEIEDELRSYIRTYFERCMHLPSWPDKTPIMFTDNNILGLPPIELPDTIIQKLNISQIDYKSALNQRTPLGGSALFHTGRWITIEMAEILAPYIIEFENKPAKERNKLTKQFAKNQKLEKNKDNETNETNETNEKKIKQKEEKSDLEVLPEPCELTEWFKEIFDEFNSNWIIDNEFDGHREDLIKIELFSKAQIELRTMVDKIIEDELTMLKKAYAEDLGKKYKAPKRKSTKSSKKSKSKDKLLNLDGIFEELVKNNMIVKSVTSKFNEFQGEISYCASLMRGEPDYLDIPYDLGDIRQIFKELFVIGLTFPELRTLKKIKFSSSLLIAGPLKSGKTMLVNAICTETGSLKIQLTLKNVSENCSNIKEINQLVNKIIKLAEAYQPVVIEVELADVPFYKKIPKDLKIYKPKLMYKMLAKLTKSLKKTERIIVVGKAKSPWLTRNDRLTKIFETIIFTVHEDKTLFMFLNDLIMRHSAVNPEFPVSAISSLLANYPRQIVADIVADVLTIERVLILNHKPLSPMEFIPVIMKYPKPESNLRNRYHNWYSQQVPLGVAKRLKMKKSEKETKKTKN